MVNCKNCGAPLSLQDAYCPYCGSANPEAIEHLKKLAVLDKGYRKAQKEVSEEVRKTKKGYGPLIILVILLLFNLLLLPVYSASYEIADRINVKKYSKQDITAIADGLLDNGEYAEFYKFFDHYDLNYSDYRDYYQIFNLCSSYVSMFTQYNNYRFGIENYTDPLIRMCDHIKQFNDDYELYYKRLDTSFTKNHFEKLKKEYDLFLKTFLKFNDEDIADISNMNSSEIVVLSLKRLNNEE